DDIATTFALHGDGGIVAMDWQRRAGEVRMSWAATASRTGRMLLTSVVDGVTTTVEIPTPRESLRGYAALADWLARGGSEELVEHLATWGVDCEDPSQVDVERRL